MTYPSPPKDILMGFMNPNLSQILRTWVVSVLLSGEVYLPPLDPTNLNQLMNPTTRSNPSSLIVWQQTLSSTSTPDNIINITSDKV